MTIDFDFQHNTSELVAYLGDLTQEELITAMVRISESTGWTWRLPIGVKPKKEPAVYDLLLPNHRIGELVKKQWTGDNYDIRVLGEPIMEIYAEFLPEHVMKKIRMENEKGELYPTLLNIPASDLIKIRKDSLDAGLPIDYHVKDRESNMRAGIYIWINCQAISSFPIFHMVRKVLDAPFLDAGGGYVDYVLWMAEHFTNLTEGEKNALFWNDYGPSWKEMIDLIKGTPPLPDSGELNSIEQKRIKEEIFECESFSVDDRIVEYGDLSEEALAQLDEILFGSQPVKDRKSFMALLGGKEP